MPPKLIPIATTTNPIIAGARFAPGGILNSSVIAKIRSTSNPVPINWSRNPACGGPGKAGKVVKTPAVFSSRGSVW